MKYIFAIAISLMCWGIGCVTRTVALDGSQQYTSIQTAINACSDGDIVTVYPGDYPENLNTNGRSITLQSLYPVTQSEETINNTIIHGNYTASCLKAENGETVTLNGFKLMNNYPENLAIDFYDVFSNGGGVKISSDCSMQILNCVITHCIAITAGGIDFGGINLYLSNTRIYGNYAVEDAGGLRIWGANANSIVFDQVLPCSIYNNSGLWAMDVLVQNCSTALHIPFSIFSTVISEPDGYFSSSHNSAAITFSIASAYFQIQDHDLFVSITGNDLNSGLSPDAPLKTIASAIKRIASDSLNISTIHLAAGVYNISESNQFYPLNIKSYVRLVGDDNGGTVFNSENYSRPYFGFSYKKNVSFENIKFIGNPNSGAPIAFGGCNNITLRNLEFDGSFGYPNSIDSTEDDGVLIENVICHNSIQENTNEALRVYNTKNMILNNFILNNQVILNDGGNANGLTFWESDVVIRNSILSNCRMHDAHILMYQNIVPAHSEYNLELSNTLIFRNQSDINMWSNAPVTIQNRFQRVKITNCTIANNYGSTTTAMRLFGYGDIYNSVIYNPTLLCDLALENVNEEIGTFDQSIHYSLVRAVGADDWNFITVDNVYRDSIPRFIGAIDGTPAITSPDYYKLSATSPCINAGTPDTTGLNIPPMDLAGNYRIWDNRIDMGCYEYGAPPVSNVENELPVLPDMIALTTFPNPVSLSGTTGGYAFVEFTLPEQPKEQPEIEIFNIKGQRVKTIRLSQSYSGLVRKAGLSDQVKQNGEFYSTVWDCRDGKSRKVASGVYIVKASSGGRQAVRKLMVVR